MPTARDFATLPPLLTDADWRVVFAFYGATVADPEPLPHGVTLSLVITPSRQRQPAAGDVHELAADAAITIGDGYWVEVVLPAADAADWTPGQYSVELRATLTGGRIYPLYLGSVVVARSLSAAAALGGIAPLPTAGADVRAITLDGIVHSLPLAARWDPPRLDFTDPDNFALGVILGVF